MKRPPRERPFALPEVFRMKDRLKSCHVIAVELADIVERPGLIHAVPHRLKHSVEVGGGNDMDQVLGDLTGANALTADDLHVFVGVTDFDLHHHSIYSSSIYHARIRSSSERADAGTAVRSS